MRRLLLVLLALSLPIAVPAQTSVNVIASDTVQSGCVLNAANATCTVPTRGKSTAGCIVTAVSSPTGITLVAETSRDGTNWDQRKFVDLDTGNRIDSVPNASLAVGYQKSIMGAAGLRFVRVRASAWTSGSVTVAVVASDSLPFSLDVAQGDSVKPTYTACSAALANTASSSAIVCESGSTKQTTIRAVYINQVGSQTTAAVRVQTLRRTTTASSAGTAVTPTPVDSGDAAYSGTCRTKPTAGTAGTTILTLPIWVPTAVANQANPIQLWPPMRMGGATTIKDLKIPVGTANGIEVNDAGASGGANYYICMVLTEE